MNALPQKIKLIGKNFINGTNNAPAICQLEMVPTDVARSHLLVDSSYAGWGPFGYLYQIEGDTA